MKKIRTKNSNSTRIKATGVKLDRVKFRNSTSSDCNNSQRLRETKTISVAPTNTTERENQLVNVRHKRPKERSSSSNGNNTTKLCTTYRFYWNYINSQQSNWIELNFGLPLRQIRATHEVYEKQKQFLFVHQTTRLNIELANVKHEQPATGRSSSSNENNTTKFYKTCLFLLQVYKCVYILQNLM